MTVPDRVELRAMRFRGRHGALPIEAERDQPFEVDVVMELDVAAAGKTDDLARTADYGLVFGLVREVVEGPHVALIETLAERIATSVLAELAVVGAVTVRVRKPEVPLPGDLDWAGVEIRRTR
jgi:dihydroneopterin aldolase